MLTSLLASKSQPVRFGLTALCRGFASGVTPVKDNGVVGKSDRAEVEALVAKYAKDVLDEVDVRKFEAWQKAGYLDPTGIPNFSLSSRDPEYMKVWKWHMQREDGKLVWQKGKYDSIVNGLLGCYTLVIILVLAYNTFWLVVPPSKNPWIFKEGKVPPLIGSSH